MRCPRIDDHLRADLDARAIDALQRHAESCSACARRRSLLDDATAALAFEPPAFDRRAVARWRAAAEAQSARPGWNPWTACGATALAVAVIAAVLMHTPADEAPALPHDRWTEIAAGTVVEVRGARIRAETPLALYIPTLETDELRIGYGAAVVELEDTPRTRPIATPSGRIALGAGRFDLLVDGTRTRLDVRAGRARAGGTELAAGHTATLEREPHDAALPAPELGNGGERARPEREPAPSPSPHAERDERGSAPHPPRTAETAALPRAARDRRDVRAARALVGRDDVRAAAMAEEVIARSPAPETEAEALMVAADARRRRGDLAGAERHYGRAAEHAGGAGFAEEATLRRAELLDRLGRAAEAIAVLASAHDRFADGGLLPERAALEAQLRLDRGDVLGAARVLDRVADRADAVLDAPRAALARKRDDAR